MGLQDHLCCEERLCSRMSGHVWPRGATTGPRHQWRCVLLCPRSSSVLCSCSGELSGWHWAWCYSWGWRRGCATWPLLPSSTNAAVIRQQDQREGEVLTVSTESGDRQSVRCQVLVARPALWASLRASGASVSPSVKLRAGLEGQLEGPSPSWPDVQASTGRCEREGGLLRRDLRAAPSRAFPAQSSLGCLPPTPILAFSM